VLSSRYVHKDFGKEGTVVSVNVRGKVQPCQVVRMPFVETRYYKAP
jgi:aminomethyltransferase